ncbi:MAG: ABC transporter ATP-binding protein [Clostridiales bacterium]|nr:ABC transporter ATP-binding protein [Candidatus Blautia equi]
MKTVLKVENLTKTFYSAGRPPFVAVDHVDLELFEGEILGVVGESGSGKSTIAKLITRLIDASEGTVTLYGKDITNLKGRELREVYKDIQMVFQNPVGSFNPRRTLGQGIGESLQNKGLSRREIDEKVANLLEQCGLPAAFADRYPHEVSGGQCQRAAIARALAIDSRILICDEATSALDVTVQAQIIELLKDLQKKKGMSYIFICHNLALVQMFCDRVVVLFEGKIVEEGIPDEVIRNPKSDYTRRLVDSVLD